MVSGGVARQDGKFIGWAFRGRSQLVLARGQDDALGILELVDAVQEGVQATGLVLCQLNAGFAKEIVVVEDLGPVGARANSRSLSVAMATLCSHELKCSCPVAAHPLRGFLYCVYAFQAE